MNSTISLKLKKLFITMLSFLLAFCMLFTCACAETPDNDDDDDDTTEEVTIADAQILNNGDFEFYTTEKTVYPYSSSVKWTRSNDSDKSSAPTSSYSSGIIDVSSTAYASLADKNKPVDTTASGTDPVYLNPQTPYYYGLIDNAYDKDKEDTHVNPNTSGSKILMIHNKLDSTPNHGTAQYFTSSSTLTIPKSGYAKISVWIKTENLVSNMTSDDKFGAYMLLENTVNSNEYNDIIFNNINTKGEWALFETYITGDELFDSTFKVVFGLGQGNGTNHQRFVEGFAYFDNAKFETYTKAEYEALTLPTNVFDVTSESSYDVDLSSITYVDNGDAKDYNAQNTTYYTTTACLLNYKFIPAYSPAVMTDANSSFNTSVLPSGLPYDLSNGNKIGAGSLNSVKSTLSTQSQNALTSIENDLDVTNPNLIYFDFANASTASHTIDSLVINAKSYIRYSFYTKIKITNSSPNKFKVEVIDNPGVQNEKKTSLFSGISTTSVTNGEYGNWIKYDVYLANVTDTNVNYALKFTFGIDEGKISQTNADLTKGYAFVADLRSYATQTEEEFEKYNEIYSAVTSSNTLGKLSLLGNYSNFSDPEEDSETADSYNITVDLSQQFEIVKNPVTNLENNYNLDNISSDTVHGIINTKYIDNYTANVGDKAYLKDTLAGDSSLQLLMLNNTANTNSYYETFKANLAKESVLKVAVVVAVTDNAKAYVNLLVKNDDGEYELATIKGNNDAWTENLTINATKQNFTTLGQKFITLTMYVATGNRSFDYKLQVGNEGQGAIYIRSIASVTSTVEDFFTERDAITEDFATISGLELVKKEYTRPDATVKSLDENGNVVESTRTFEPYAVFTGNNLYKFIDYATIDVDNVIDETDIVEDDEEEDTTTTDPVYVTPKNIALEIISIILSVVLLGVLITVLIRNVIKSRRDKIDTTKTYYDRNSREKALNAISEKKKRINVDDDETDEEYDYTLAEKVGEEDVTEEVIDLDTLTQAPIDESETPTDDTPNGDGE